MKLKQALAATAALACMSGAHAQSANTFYVTTGWFHFAPQDSSDPLKIDSAGGTPVNMAIPNTGASISSSDTVGFSVGYFITDHLATEAELGIPPKFDLSGSGMFSRCFRAIAQTSITAVAPAPTSSAAIIISIFSSPVTCLNEAVRAECHFKST